mgnify:CR=1 FL=1
MLTKLQKKAIFAVMQKVKDLINFIGVWQTIASLAGFFATLWQTYQEALPWHLILFYSFGVFFFISVGIASIHYTFRQLTVFKRLAYIHSVPMIHADVDQKTIGLYFKCTLKNISPFKTMYAKLERGECNLQGKTNSQPEHKEPIIIVPPLQEFSLIVPEVPNLDTNKTITGKLEVEVLYGDDENNLPYKLSYKFEPIIKISRLKEASAEMHFSGALIKYEHKKS